MSGGTNSLTTNDIANDAQNHLINIIGQSKVISLF